MRSKFASGYCVFVFALVIILISAATGQAAEKFPTKPVKYIIGWGAGGGSDIVGRLFKNIDKGATDYFSLLLGIGNSPQPL